MVMIAMQEGFDVQHQRPYILGFVFLPSQALLSHGAVEAFDERLFVLLVRSGDAMLVAVVPDFLCELFLKLAAPIGLHDCDKAIETSPHAAM